MDWLGDVGGLSEVLMTTAVFMVGGYANYSGKIEMMLHLYSDKALFAPENNLSTKDVSLTRMLNNKLSFEVLKMIRKATNHHIQENHDTINEGGGAELS